MRAEERQAVTAVIVICAIILIIIALIIGPAGCTNTVAAWRASAYGSDWLVVQYAVDGSIINSWDLKNCAIHNEGNSDGIYFTTSHGVVHLSGHYVYIQSPTDETRKLLGVTK